MVLTTPGIFEREITSKNSGVYVQEVYFIYCDWMSYKDKEFFIELLFSDFPD